MARTVLTDLALRRLVPPAGQRIELWDAYIEGFGFRSTKHGQGSFFVMYRVDGRQRRQTLGRFPAMTLEDARQQARDALTKARNGIDPAIERDLKAEMETRRKARTVEGAVRDFIALYPRYRPSTRAEVERLLRREVLPLIGPLPVSDVTRRDVARLVNVVADRGSGTTANRLLSYLQAFFRWLVERGELEATPCVNLGKPTPERSRDRVLDDAELATIWRAADAMATPFVRLVQLLILTGQRRGEVAAIRPCDVDLKASVWTLPREFTKSDRVHVVPLSRPAVEILDCMLRPAKAEPPAADALLFTPARMWLAKGDAMRAMSGWTKLKTALDAKAAELAGDPLAPWTLHDLRRTVASGMAGLAVAPHVVERLLNHSSGAIRGVAAIYNRHSYQPEMRAAVESWAKHVGGLKRTASKCPSGKFMCDIRTLAVDHNAPNRAPGQRQAIQLNSR